MSAVDPSPPSPEPTPLSFPISGRPELGRVPWADHCDPSAPAPADPRRNVRAEPPRLRWDLRSTEVRDEGVPSIWSIPLEGAALDHRAGRWLARWVNARYAEAFSTTWAIVLVAPSPTGQRLLVLVTPDEAFGAGFDDDGLRRHLDDALGRLAEAAGGASTGASHIPTPVHRLAR